MQAGQGSGCATELQDEHLLARVRKTPRVATQRIGPSSKLKAKRDGNSVLHPGPARNGSSSMEQCQIAQQFHDAIEICFEQLLSFSQLKHACRIDDVLTGSSPAHESGCGPVGCGDVRAE